MLNKHKPKPPHRPFRAPWPRASALLWPSLLLALCCRLASAQPLPFGLFGDTPYSAWERAQLPGLMADMAAADPAFVVHAGDFKSGADACSDALFQDRLALFQASRVPLVYVPGDNDWTDCHRRSNGAYDPLERLERLRGLFFVSEYSLGQKPMPLLRQSADPVRRGPDYNNTATVEQQTLRLKVGLTDIAGAETALRAAAVPVSPLAGQGGDVCTKLAAGAAQLN